MRATVGPAEPALEIDEVTSAGAPGFAGLLAVTRAGDAEASPGDPPVPAAELAAELFAPEPGIRVRAWLASEAGAPVGAAVVRRHCDGANDAVAHLAVTVVPGRRRRGVGRRLAATALRASADDGATSVLGWPTGEAGEAFCRVLGLTARQRVAANRLLVSAVDAGQQRRWIDEAPARATGYRLVGWVGTCPDDRADALARALDAMADAPLDEIEWQPHALTAAEVQARDRAADARGYDPVTTLALAPDGAPAGATQLLVSRWRPSLAHQDDTCVLAAHRGLGLGRWLKAANLRRALVHQPVVAVVETANAATNAHMNAVNEAMGFRPHRTVDLYQGPLRPGAAG